MAQLMSEARMFMDRTKYLSHMSELEDIIKAPIVKESVTVNELDSDLKFFGDIGMSIVSRLNGPLHTRIGSTDGKIIIAENIEIKREKDDELQKKMLLGRSSQKFELEREYKLTLPKDAARRFLLPAPSGYNDTIYNEFNNVEYRVKSVSKTLETFTSGGDSSMKKNHYQHKILERLGRADSNKMLCINLYFLLMKSIMLYTMDNFDQYGNEISFTAVQLTCGMLSRLVETRDCVILVDSFTRNELSLLIMAYEGHQCVKLVNRSTGEEDIYSRVIVGQSNYKVCTRREAYAKKFTGFLQPPELLLDLIVTIVCKLGCVSDWLETPEFIRGVPMFLSLSDDLMPDGYDESQAFTLDCRPDSSYSTIFGAVCNDQFLKGCKMSNLAASTASLMSDILFGQAYMNNIHYVMEDYGLANRKLYTDNNYTMFRSIAADTGILDCGMQAPLVLEIFAQSNTAGLFNNVRFLSGVLRAYMDAFRNGGDVTCVWQSMNLIFGTVGVCNSTQCIGKHAIVSAESIRSKIDKPNNTLYLMDWLYMHGVMGNRTHASGLTYYATGALSFMSNDVYSVLTHISGKYYCSFVGLSIKTVNTARAGINSQLSKTAYSSLAYFSFGGNREDAVEEVQLCENVNVSEDIDVKLVTDLTAKSDNVKYLQSTLAGKKGEKVPKVVDHATDIKTQLTEIDDMYDVYSDIRDAIAPSAPELAEWRFDEIQTPGDGNCAAWVLTKYYEDQRNMNELELIRDEIGFDSSLYQWQHDGFIVAINQMMNRDTHIYSKEGDTYALSVYAVDKPLGVCHVLKRGQHFSLLKPSEAGKFVVPVANTVRVDSNFTSDVLPPGLADSYYRFLKQNMRDVSRKEVIEGSVLGVKLNIGVKDEDVKVKSTRDIRKDAGKYKARKDVPMAIDPKCLST